MKTPEALQKASDTSELLTQDLCDLVMSLCVLQTTEERIAWYHVMQLLTEAVSLRQKIQSLKA